ncbi:hypothetical protein [Delftia sp. GW456-R20]|uniref:antitoxin VbhA family protein n=1 Tax=Delftia sp. GW456-R20 TaxID=1827145 RepID=UPI000B33E91F|nr:hypothetical protein [Delftia sp. GW456-R20]
MKIHATGEDSSFSNGTEFAYEQALANARIEGFVPDAKFTADYLEMKNGNITADEFRARVYSNAKAVEEEATKGKPSSEE